MTEPSNPKWQQDLGEALRSAYAPTPLSEERHEALLLAALEDPLAPPSQAELEQAETLRRALELNGDTEDAALARALRHAATRDRVPTADVVERALEQALPKPRGNVIFVAFGVAASALAVAAGVALFVLPVPNEPGALGPSRLVPSRSFAPLVDSAGAQLSASARLDRLVEARERDLRSNRYTAWGVR